MSIRLIFRKKKNNKTGHKILHFENLENKCIYSQKKKLMSKKKKYILKSGDQIHIFFQIIKKVILHYFYF